MLCYINNMKIRPRFDPNIDRMRQISRAKL